MRRCTELGSQSGYQKRTRELAVWARRRRHIRRDELLAFLSGKSPPPKTHHFRGSPRTRLSLDRMNPRLPSSHQPHNPHGHEENLNTFREALGIHPTPPLPSRRRSSAHSPELQSFIVDEFARNKRPAPSSSPSHDVTMDSPQHKRFKLT
ncbi:UNVERIFIED_CONTAM: hypothetical protein GTU68_051797 [Idotea baltica]|nr:hypothetical protein [Idotea baltica]